MPGPAGDFNLTACIPQQACDRNWASSFPLFATRRAPPFSSVVHRSHTSPSPVTVSQSSFRFLSHLPLQDEVTVRYLVKTCLEVVSPNEGWPDADPQYKKTRNGYCKKLLYDCSYQFLLHEARQVCIMALFSCYTWWRIYFSPCPRLPAHIGRLCLQRLRGHLCRPGLGVRGSWMKVLIVNSGA